GRATTWAASVVAVVQASKHNLQESRDSGDTEQLIAFIKEIQRGAPGEPQTLPLLAELQAKAGHRDDAIATIRGALSDASNHELLLALVDISRRHNLGIDAEILAKLPADASSSPRLALERAMDLAHAGKKEEGLKLLSDPSQQSLAWKVAQAEYLEATGDARAEAAWIALGDENR